jgi:hypothetical protein
LKLAEVYHELKLVYFYSAFLKISSSIGFVNRSSAIGSPPACVLARVFSILARKYHTLLHSSVQNKAGKNAGQSTNLEAGVEFPSFSSFSTGMIKHMEGC